MLADDFEVEFWAIYNFEQLGKWDLGLPKNVKVRHVQWHPKVYTEELSEVDIGIVPSCMPIKAKSNRKSRI